MQFCKDCGGVLNLFGKNERELCSSCIQQKKRTEPAPPRPPAAVTQRSDLLDDAVLSFSEGKLILRSKEGWELWSAPADALTDMKTILSRARRIYEIRLRRQRN